ncbi:MAG: hypothetical protein QOH35_2387 [Acidobacteriaceae bacterium]|nr:hypothetical protein [Acidobacteriaceae bacterium]
MCRVFDYVETVAGGEMLNSVHIARLSGKMDRQNGAGPARNFFSSFLGIDTERYRVHIDQHRNGLEINDDLGSRRERGCRRKHFIALLQSDCFECKVERRGARTDADGMPGADIGCKVLLEFNGLRPHREPAGTDNVRGGPGFVFSHACRVEWNGLLCKFHDGLRFCGKR